MKKIITTLIVLLSIPLTFAEDCVGVCSQSEVNLIPISSSRNIDELNLVSEKNKTKMPLATARISYGALGIGVGNADIYVTVKDGKLVDLNIDAKVGLLGINEEIKQKVTIDRLKQGTPLQFFMQGSERPILRVRPAQGFSELGGRATLEIWDGDKYVSETITISSNMGPTYKVYHGQALARNQITGLKINMGGSSIARMYVRKYDIETR